MKRYEKAGGGSRSRPAREQEPARKQKEATTLGRPVALSRQDVADALGLSIRSVDYAIARGDLVAKHYGRRVLVPGAEIERYLEKLEAVVHKKTSEE